MVYYMDITLSPVHIVDVTWIGAELMHHTVGLIRLFSCDFYPKVIITWRSGTCGGCNLYIPSALSYSAYRYIYIR